MENIQNTYNQPQIGQMPQQRQMMPPPPFQGVQLRQPLRNQPTGWKGRWMRRFGMDVAAAPMRKGELTIPNWMIGKSVVVFFIAMFACWGAFGYVPELNLWLTAALSIVLFFGGGAALSRSTARSNEKAFLKNIFLVGMLARLAWVAFNVLYFNPEYFANTMGDESDTRWYMDFAHDIAHWITGDMKMSFTEVMSKDDAAIDDTGYPVWLAIGYLFWGDWSDVVMPMVVKCLVSAYCAICIYNVAKRHFGEGAARMAAIFIALNPNMIYWCGNMFKEAEMVFLCCIFVDETDKALSSDKYTFKALLPGLLAGMSLFFFRAALGIAAFVAVFAHIVMASQRVMSVGKKIIAGILVVITLLVGMGDSLRTKTEKIFETAQSTEAQEANMKWRTEREGGNKFAEYAGAAVFAPLIFTIPFPTFNQAETNQLLQVQLSGGYFIKNIFSFFVIMVMLMMLISSEWRRHVFILAYTVGYLGVLVLSNFAQSGRFHMPVWPMLMLFAAYGIQIAKTNGRLRRWFTIVLVLEVFVSLAWNWFKLAGRGMI